MKRQCYSNAVGQSVCVLHSIYITNIRKFILLAAVDKFHDVLYQIFSNSSSFPLQSQKWIVYVVWQ